jgi:TonB family protein
MNAQAVEPGHWSRSRWWLIVIAIFTAHIGLILALGDRKPIVTRQPAATPHLRLANNNDEFLALNDPTLFALPHANGFASAPWMEAPRVQAGSFQWSEPPRWLQLPVEQLGAAFSHFMETNIFARFTPELKAAPELTVPYIMPIEPAPASNSFLRVEGDLAQRPLASPVQVPPWPAADLLAGSTVQVLVDDAGNVISTTLLPPGSGSPEADQRALSLAMSARFVPLPRDGRNGVNPAIRWIRGTMVFQWFTVPLPQTNAPPTNP